MRYPYGLTLSREHIEWDALTSEKLPKLRSGPTAEVIGEFTLCGTNRFDAKLPPHVSLGATSRREEVRYGLENEVVLLGDLLGKVLYHECPANHFDIDRP